jgi:hypothetical protein
MNSTARRLGPVTAPLALLTVLLTGCSDGKKADEGAWPETTPSGPAPTVRAGTLGPAGSLCPMPVSFDYAKDWQPKKIDMKPDPEIDLFGPFQPICEIDGKFAGHIGFIRVFAAEQEAGDTPEKAVRALVAAEKDEVREAEYDTFDLAGLQAAEVRLTTYSELMESEDRVRAFAVATPRGLFLVRVGGLDREEFTNMIPAYEMAKRTLRPVPASG